MFNHDITVRVIGIREPPEENVVVGYIIRVVDTEDQFVAVERACHMVTEKFGTFEHLGAARQVHVGVMSFDSEDGDNEELVGAAGG